MSTTVQLSIELAVAILLAYVLDHPVIAERQGPIQQMLITHMQTLATFVWWASHTNHDYGNESVVCACRLCFVITVYIKLWRRTSNSIN